MGTATVTAAKISYRKTAKGEWVAFGPVSAMPALTPGVNPEVAVSKRDGTIKTERVTGFGRPFQVSGVAHVYAYLAKSAPAASAARPAPRRPARHVCDNCGERPATTTARDLSGFAGEVCWQCKREEGALSFC
jgi:hypothetical protein